MGATRALSDVVALAYRAVLGVHIDDVMSASAAISVAARANAITVASAAIATVGAIVGALGARLGKLRGTKQVDHLLDALYHERR